MLHYISKGDMLNAQLHFSWVVKKELIVTLKIWQIMEYDYK